MHVIVFFLELMFDPLFVFMVGHFTYKNSCHVGSVRQGNRWKLNAKTLLECIYIIVCIYIDTSMYI